MRFTGLIAPKAESPQVERLRKLAAQLEAVAGAGASEKFLATAAETQIAHLRKQATPDNPKAFDNWIARIKRDGLSAWEATDYLSEEIIRVQGEALRKPATRPLPASHTIPAPAIATSTSTPPAMAPETITAGEFRALTKAPTMLRSEWDKLSHDERNTYIRAGGKIVNPPRLAPTRPAPDAKTMTREQLDSIPPEQRSAFFKRGGKLVATH